MWLQCNAVQCGYNAIPYSVATMQCSTVQCGYNAIPYSVARVM